VIAALYSIADFDESAMKLAREIVAAIPVSIQRR
jgi:hypothetical protein